MDSSISAFDYPSEFSDMMNAGSPELLRGLSTSSLNPMNTGFGHSLMAGTDGSQPKTAFFSEAAVFSHTFPDGPPGMQACSPGNEESDCGSSEAGGGTLSEQAAAKSARLARKAESARESRRRKKSYIQNLEDQVSKLSQKLNALQAAHGTAGEKFSPGSEVTTEHTESSALSRDEQDSKEIAQNLRRLLQEPVNEIAVMTLVEQFVAHSKLRQSRMEYQLDRFQQCLSPGLQVKFLLWGFDKPSDFFDQPELWWLVMAKEIQLSESQIEELKTKRFQFVKERKALLQLFRLLAEFRKYIITHLTNVHNELEILRQIMTPEQLAKFFLRIHDDQPVADRRVGMNYDDYFSSELHAPGSPSSPSSFQGSQQSPFDASQFDPMCGDMGDDDEMMFCNLSQSCPL